MIREVKKNLDAELAKKQWKKVTQLLGGEVGVFKECKTACGAGWHLPQAKHSLFAELYRAGRWACPVACRSAVMK